MIQMLSPEGITLEVVPIGTDFDDDSRVEKPMAVVLHGGTHSTVIEGTRDEIEMLLMEALVLVKGWEPPNDHDWVLTDAFVFCRRCEVRIDPEALHQVKFDCDYTDVMNMARIDNLTRSGHVWGKNDQNHWYCVRCGTQDTDVPCITT